MYVCVCACVCVCAHVYVCGGVAGYILNAYFCVRVYASLV